MAGGSELPPESKFQAAQTTCAVRRVAVSRDLWLTTNSSSAAVALVTGTRRNKIESHECSIPHRLALGDTNESETCGSVPGGIKWPATEALMAKSDEAGFMDVLAGIGPERLQLWIWILVLVFAVAAGLWRRHQLVLVALASVLLFATLNAGAGIYILKRLGDPRWTTGQPPVSSPELSGIPIVGQQLEPLESALEGVAGGVNSFWEFNQALPVALDFFARSGWALLVAIALIIVVMIRNFKAARKRRRDLLDLAGTVAQLQAELATIKEHLPRETSLNVHPQHLGQTRANRTRRSGNGE